MDSTLDISSESVEETVEVIGMAIVTILMTLKAEEQADG